MRLLATCAVFCFSSTGCSDLPDGIIPSRAEALRTAAANLPADEVADDWASFSQPLPQPLSVRHERLRTDAPLYMTAMLDGGVVDAEPLVPDYVDISDTDLGDTDRSDAANETDADDRLPEHGRLDDAVLDRLVERVIDRLDAMQPMRAPRHEHDFEREREAERELIAEADAAERIDREVERRVAMELLERDVERLRDQVRELERENERLRLQVEAREQMLHFLKEMQQPVRGPRETHGAMPTPPSLDQPQRVSPE